MSEHPITCRCEWVNGARYVCDECRRASQQEFDARVASVQQQIREHTVRERLYAIFSVSNPAAQRAAEYVSRERITDYNPRPRLTPTAYLALIFAEMD